NRKRFVFQHRLPTATSRHDGGARRGRGGRGRFDRVANGAENDDEVIRICPPQPRRCRRRHPPPSSAPAKAVTAWFSPAKGSCVTERFIAPTPARTTARRRPASACTTGANNRRSGPA